MRARVQLPRLGAHFRVGYLLTAPPMLLLSVYLAAYVAINSHHGSEIAIRLLNDWMPGSAELAYLRVGPTFTDIAIYDAVVRDLHGRQVVTIGRIGCTLHLPSLLANHVDFRDCTARNATLLADEQTDGDFGFIEAFRGDWPHKGRNPDPALISFSDIQIADLDVLVNVDDMAFRLDSVDVRGGRIAADRDMLDMDADFIGIGGGRLIFTERMLQLGDNKHDWDWTQWEILRHSRPWQAMRATLPPPPPGFHGALDMPLGRGALARLHWTDNTMAFDRVDLPVADARVLAEGWLRLVAERPKLPRAERGIVYYDGRLSASLSPDSVLFDYFFPDLIAGDPAAPPGDVQLDPITFDAWGNMRFTQFSPTRLSFRRIHLLGWPISDFDAELTLDQGRLTLSDGATAHLWGGTLSGGGWFVPREGTWELRLCASDLHLDQAAAPFTTGDSEMLRRWLGAVISTSLSECGPGAPTDLVASGDLTRKGLELWPAWTTREDGEIQPPMVEVRADGLSVRWSSAPPGLPVPELRADLSGRLTQRGVLELATPEGRPGVVIRAGSDTWSFRGAIDVPGRMLAPSVVRFGAADFSRWLAAWGVPSVPQGLSLTAEALVGGPIDAPALSRFTLDATRTPPNRTAVAFSATASGGVEGDELRIDEAHVRSPVGDLELSGRVGLFDGSLFRARAHPSLALDVGLRRLEVNVLLGSDDLLARIESDFHVGGTSADPAADGQLLATAIRLYDEPIDIVQGEFSVTDRVVDLRDLFLVKGKGVLRGRLRYEFDSGLVDADLHGRRFRFDEFLVLDDQNVDLEGEVRLDLRATGVVPSPDVEGSLIGTDIRLFGRDVGGFAFAFDTADGRLIASGELGGDMDLDLATPISGGPIEISGTIRNSRIADHWPEFARLASSSNLSADVAVRLDPFETGTYSADVDLLDLSLQAGDRAFAIPEPARLEWRAEPDDEGTLRHRVSVSDFALGTGERFVHASGTIGDFHDVGFVAWGDLDMSLLRFLPNLIVDAEGVAQIALKMGGDVDRPLISGWAEFEQARIAPRGLGTNVYFAPGRLEVASDRVVIARENPLSGTLFGGDFSAWGTIGLERFLPDSADLHAFVTGLAYRIPNELNITLTGGIDFRAPDFDDYTTWGVAGDIEIVDARYYQNFDVVSETLAFGDIGRTAEEFELPIWQREPIIGAMHTDLRITGRDQFLFESRIMNAEMELELQTDLVLGGTFGAMELTGEMEVLDGSRVFYRGREFRVDRATLLFDGYRDADGFPWPVIDSQLVTEITPCQRATTSPETTTSTGGFDSLQSQKVRITTLVNGLLPYDMTFQLQSTPSYDQRDQLSLIVTGCTFDALTATSAGTPTLDLVFRPFIDLVERNVEERFALEDVDLIPSAEGSAAVIIQDEVTERLSWQMNALVGSEGGNQQGVSGMYRVFDWLVLELREESGEERNVTINSGVRVRVQLDSP